MKTRGFTLIELMIAIAIIGILATVALPGIKRLWFNDGPLIDIAPRNGHVVERNDGMFCNGGFLVKSDGQVITQDGKAIKC